MRDSVAYLTFLRGEIFFRTYSESRRIQAAVATGRVCCFFCHTVPCRVEVGRQSFPQRERQNGGESRGGESDALDPHRVGETYGLTHANLLSKISLAFRKY